MPIRNSAAELKLDLQKWADGIDIALEKVVRAVVFELFKKIIQRTPIDKGRAAGSWGISRSNPGPGDDVLPAGQGGSREIAIAKLGSVSFSPPQGIWWIFNNLPYIEVLEFGYFPNPTKSKTGKTVAGFSIQAPAGMVRIAIAEMEVEWESLAARALSGRS